ncbi:UDP-4-amino-4,6-dideoxy-N-acetyl-beta-L-altrosamine N-acetyltransferase [Gammaproteobacteria bacterium AS21]
MLKVKFKPVQFSDLELLRQWRNSPRISNNMYNNDFISQQQQEGWFESLQHDECKIYFVCLLDDKAVGTLYFTDIKESSCEWGCYLGGESLIPGLGLILEAAALEYAFNYLKIKTLNADVLTFNTPAKKMHKLFKYNELGIEDTEIIRGNEILQVCKYNYCEINWLSNKEQVFKSLPKKLVTSIRNIKFIKE